MGRIYNELSELIGETPLFELHRYRRNRNLDARLLGKIEYFNPAGSVKDRISWSIVRDAEERGLLKPGDTIVDVTSGNTGIGLAAIAASRGYRAKFYASDNISADKIRLLEHYGAEVVPVPNAFFLDPLALEKITARVQEENPDAYFTNQLGNPANPKIHFETTGPEIWRDTDGAVDIFVGAVGTGGTISGVGRFLKSQKPEVRIVVAEPGEDSLPTEENPYPDQIDGVHKVTDVEPVRLPDNYDAEVVDEVIALDTPDARGTARALAAEEGIFAGISSGATLFAATQLAGRPENAGKTIVVLLPDTGERYLTVRER